MANHSIFIGRQLAPDTVQWLNKASVRYEAHTLIAITLNDINDEILEPFRKQNNSWVLTSQWSAQWLSNNHLSLGIEAQDEVFCLSTKQQEILAQLLSKCIIAEVPNVDSLIKRIKEEKKGEHIVYLRGNKSLRTINQNTISSDNAVKELEVYNNQPLRLRVRREFDAYVFFSPSGIDSFIEAGNTISPSASIFTIGSTTCTKARDSFNGSIYESTTADELAFIQFVVRQLYRL